MPRYGVNKTIKNNGRAFVLVIISTTGDHRKAQTKRLSWPAKFERPANMPGSVGVDFFLKRERKNDAPSLQCSGIGSGVCAVTVQCVCVRENMEMTV